MPITIPSPEEVGGYYDTLGPFYQIVWGDSIHFGYWDDPADVGVSMARAQQRFTDLMIEQMALGPGQRALDVGCGTGRPGIRLAQRSGGHVTGITVSQSQLAQARANAQTAGAENIRFELVNAMDLPYSDGAFDAAWAFESIFHMPSRLRVFEEMRRVVRPGGRVVVADFVWTTPLTDEQIAVVYPAFAVGDLGSLDAYIGDLKRAGLRDIRCRDVTANTIRPSNRATFAAMSSAEGRDQLAEAFGPERAAGFADGWAAIQAINETLAYVVLTAEV